jgi:hypothetical protein
MPLKRKPKNKLSFRTGNNQHTYTIRRFVGGRRGHKVDNTTMTLLRAMTLTKSNFEIEMSSWISSHFRVFLLHPQYPQLSL